MTAGDVQPLKIAAMISGGGRTLLNLADHIDAGTLPASIELVIASKENIAGVQRARDRGLNVQIAARMEGETDADLHSRTNEMIAAADVDLVCLCGWLRWMRIDDFLQGRVINIHPSILPDFGGQGMYGNHVHKAVLESSRRFSGCTVHYVDERFDHGPTILQRPCPISNDDTVDTLAARVFTEECKAYPEAIRRIATGNIQQKNGRVEIRPRPSAFASCARGTREVQ